jgi:glycosyltransferase involved in cell wall biosynthesis
LRNSKDGDENGQVPVETLNKIYNSLDVYVSTAIGGGWELTVTEAMACKVPCILPDHTSLGELGADDRAKLLVELSEICHVDDNNIRLRCLKEEVGEAILETAKNKALTEYRVEQAYEWVQQLNWDNVCEEWINLWNDVYQIE